jgi:hypothetical protein
VVFQKTIMINASIDENCQPLVEAELCCLEIAQTGSTGAGV